MRTLACLLAAALLSAAGHATADLIPPDVVPLAKRLQDNPKAFDRADDFCRGKRVRDACTIDGNTFEGGGAGICRNAINRATATIDLTCEREGRVTLDRQLPEGGFVADAYLCNDPGHGLPSRDLSCAPLTPTPADQFCKDKAEGAVCTVQLTYRGNQETHDGVCKSVIQTLSYYAQGRRTASREVIQCEPSSAPVHHYTPATWWQKLTQ